MIEHVATILTAHERLSLALSQPHEPLPVNAAVTARRTMRSKAPRIGGASPPKPSRASVSTLTLVYEELSNIRRSEGAQRAARCSIWRPGSRGEERRSRGQEDEDTVATPRWRRRMKEDSEDEELSSTRWIRYLEHLLFDSTEGACLTGQDMWAEDAGEHEPKWMPWSTYGGERRGDAEMWEQEKALAEDRREQLGNRSSVSSFGTRRKRMLS
jgi:hypothetical protein